MHTAPTAGSSRVHLASDPSARSPSRLGAWVSWLGIALYGFCGLAFWIRSDWRQEWDSAIYLLLGRSLATGGGYRYLGQPFFLRPPGLPWLLSWTSRLGPYDFALLNRLLFLAAVAALAATLVVLRPTHGLPVAAVVTAMVGTSPLFLRQLNWVVAELPFLALLLASFALFHRATRPGARFWAWSLAGALVLAAAIALRTVGLIALPVLLLLGDRRGRLVAKLRGALPAALVLLLCLPWMVYSRRAAAAAAVPSEQLLVFTYDCALWHQDPGDPASPTLSLAEGLARIVDNGGELVRAVTGAFCGTTGLAARALILGLILVGLTASWRAGPTLLDGFGAVYVLLVLVYFTFDLRLLVPLLPCFYLYFVQGSRRVWRWVAGARGWRHADAAMLAVLATVLAATNAAQLAAALHPEREVRGSITVGQHAADQRQIARWLEQHTTPAATVLADEAPIVALLSGRRTYTYRYARRAGLLDRFPSDYVVLSTTPPPTFLEEVRARAEQVAELPLAGRGRRATVWRVVH